MNPIEVSPCQYWIDGERLMINICLQLIFVVRNGEGERMCCLAMLEIPLSVTERGRRSRTSLFGKEKTNLRSAEEDGCYRFLSDKRLCWWEEKGKENYIWRREKVRISFPSCYHSKFPALRTFASIEIDYHDFSLVTSCPSWTVVEQRNLSVGGWTLSSHGSDWRFSRVDFW